MKIVFECIGFMVFVFIFFPIIILIGLVSFWAAKDHNYVRNNQ
jgi:hypothetical protein